MMKIGLQVFTKADRFYVASIEEQKEINTTAKSSQLLFSRAL